MSALARDVNTYLDQPAFALRNPAAYDRWRRAANILWSEHPEGQLSEIGHYCRESMQEFAEVLARGLPVMDQTDKTQTISRVRAAIDNASTGLGSRVTQMLKALVDYWRAVSELAQRQEHAAQREGEPLSWEDARRVVFQTALVMYELDRALRR